MLHFQEEILGKSQRKGRQKSCWIRPGRTEVCWDNLMNDVMVSQEWKVNFLKLCDELCPYIQKKSTNMRSSISVEKQVAVTLYYLSDEGRLCKSANAIGIGHN